MFKKWLGEYRRLNRESYLLSQGAAFLLSVFAVLELGYYWYLVFINWGYIYDLWNTVIVESLLKICLGAAMGVRFVFLFPSRAARSNISSYMWTLAVLVIGVYWANSHHFWLIPEPFGIYDIRRADLLLGLGLTYVWISFVRTTITLITALILSTKR